MRSRLLIILVCLCMGILSAEGAIRYVRMGGTGMGTSWSNASGDLQEMINVSLAGDEIWVAAGTYKPDRFPEGCTNCNVRDWTFFLKSGVKIYGGFAGMEMSRSERDFRQNITILSGDIGIQNDPRDNTYHVVLSILNTPDTELDGFTVRDGNANGGGTGGQNPSIISNPMYPQGSVGAPRGDAGGVYNRFSSLSANNLIITSNSASVGGGFYCLGGGVNANASLKNAFIIGNSSIVGGGIRILDAGCAVLQCVFIDNTSSRQGNDIAVERGRFTLNNSTFIRNDNNNINSIASVNNITADCINTIFSYPNEPIGGSLNITYSLSPTSNYDNMTNVMGVPAFINPSNPEGADGSYGTPDDGLRLQFYSAGVDAGFNTPDIMNDLAGQPRQVDVPATSGSSIDMGAYESQSQIFTVVTTDASCFEVANGKAVVSTTAAADLADGVTFRLVPALGIQSNGAFTNLQVNNYTVQALVGGVVRATADFSILSADEIAPVVVCPPNRRIVAPSTSCDVQQLGGV